MILPGECAPAHRHTPSALRFIIQSKGAWTAVQGERSFMEPGDFIITPSMAWHDHGHDGDSQIGDACRQYSSFAPEGRRHQGGSSYSEPSCGNRLWLYTPAVRSSHGSA